MDIQGINNYLYKVSHLKRGGMPGGGKAPHKLILTIALINLMDKGIAGNNRFPIGNLLQKEFENVWRMHITRYTVGDYLMPVRHMQNDKIWVTQDGHGRLDVDFYNFLLDKENRLELRGFLLKQLEAEGNFVPVNESIFDLKNDPLLNRIAKKVLTNAPAEPEEVYLRSVAFTSELKKLYNYTCCVSGSTVNYGSKHFLVDACHIRDFSDSHDDSVANGIVLNPYLHRAFDSGLFTVDSDFTVVVSDKIEFLNTVFSLKQFHRKKINLPIEDRYYPSKEFLEWHQDNQFENFI